MHTTWTALLALGLAAGLASADCCNPVVNCRTNFLGITTCYQCGDGSTPTPFCGNGQCNMWGCNCAGGCRGGAQGLDVRTRRPQWPINPANGRDVACSYDSTFEAAASDPSKGVSLADYLVWATTLRPAAANNATALQVFEDEFVAFDANGDGFIDFAEMHKPQGDQGYRHGL